MTRVKSVHRASFPTRGVADSFAPFARPAMKRNGSVSLLALLCALMVLAIEGRAANSTETRLAALVEW